ncbi:ubiquinol-cytochrome C chaperone-domain-containing protein [Radiomyces spectabilis]|uniref:ubiquinol-cytochrome C chaperone-domain-containing protein n=1 Tax=Radiomyces spectabilis TaxID=64574 RepID=UPI00221E7EC4|nr:ubiquinol-cytochrome C chaperone-domain-containing protein [Radiomyces spectabilis]KAI8369266.1 ubiquinol-cytochrome C chaperone-domain-containing protein [Radiomyces spectabilis]
MASLSRTLGITAATRNTLLRASALNRPRILAVQPTWSLVNARWASTHEPVKSKYSSTTKKIVYGLARIMGYYSKNSTAIRSSHSLYKACAQQMEQNKVFFIEECKLPDNFQTWFAVTQLHVWMLMVHLRAHGQGKLYIQELVNRFFEDAEVRMREQHGITQQKVINSYIKDLLAQFHGGVVAYDEGMCKDDPVLAAALWRNLFAPTSESGTDLAYMVQYIRQELKALEAYDGEKLSAGIVQFGTPVASFSL